MRDKESAPYSVRCSLTAKMLTVNGVNVSTPFPPNRKVNMNEKYLPVVRSKYTSNFLYADVYSYWAVLQVPSALAWGDAGGAGSESDSEEEEQSEALSKERKEIEEAREAAELEARETVEEKRLRLARDVLLRLDAEQQGHVSVRWALRSAQHCTHFRN